MEPSTRAHGQRRRTAAALVLVALGIAGAPWAWRRHLAWVAAVDGATVERLAGLVPLLAEAERATCRGDRIGVWTPGLDAGQASAAHYRSAYLLPERRIVPLVWYGRWMPENLAETDTLVVAGPARAAPPGFALAVDRAPAGALYRRLSAGPAMPCGPAP